MTEYGLQDVINDYLIKNLQKKFRKPMEADIHDHSVRLELLMNYTNLLPSTTITQKITEEDRKKYFLKAFRLNLEESLLLAAE